MRHRRGKDVLVVRDLAQRLRIVGDKWNEQKGVSRWLRAASYLVSKLLYVAAHPLAKNRRLEAIVRLARWELQRRTARSSRGVVVEIAPGARLRIPAWLGGEALSVGLLDYEEQLFVLNALTPGEVALDVGAYVGSYTILMAASGATVHAFEPAPQARAALASTVSLNNFDQRVQIHAIALSDYNGEASFTTEFASGNRLVRQPGAGNALTIVPVETLDEWVERSGVDDVALMKIDAEGEDERIIRGAERVLREYEPVVIAEYLTGSGKLEQTLATLGYRPCRYDPDNHRLVDAQGLQRGAGNVIAVTPGRWAKLDSRFRGSARISVGAPRVEW